MPLASLPQLALARRDLIHSIRTGGGAYEFPWKPPPFTCAPALTHPGRRRPSRRARARVLDGVGLRAEPHTARVHAHGRAAPPCGASARSPARRSRPHRRLLDWGQAAAARDVRVPPARVVSHTDAGSRTLKAKGTIGAEDEPHARRALRAGCLKRRRVAPIRA